ncbi:uncharacterized protein N7482_004765 [Penicillium canariense]|uniref:Uncharacterized protein n=1 Tax=Penicillium canariense TaxID=189055 RepID=A0A9W9I9K9_9EURO|nr:uncharacterized protein N7482_004765 [Penicillium canariense]KAJ5169171.1 hypothetical protein N7482_004765 [Penicillium canariense]
MSNPPDTPWTEEEKNTLLTEILKKAGIPSSYFLRMINEFRINPNWEHIPLPQGKPDAIYKTRPPQQHPPPPGPATAALPRPEGPGTPAPIDPTLRKRPLYPADKPPAPRAIQPRPPASTASYSSESSAQLSPRLDSTVSGEPPRKRGRPSKAETERRKAAAEARGETYPPSRRSGSGRLKIPPSPTSPASLAPYPSAPAPQPIYGPSAGSLSYDITATRPIAPAPSLPGAQERQDVQTRSMGPNLRELPRPTEMGHPLPSPHTLQLGPPAPFPRLNSNPGERSAYGTIPPGRFSPPDSGRRDSAASRGEPTAGPYEDRTSTTPGEKPPG